MLLHYLAKRGNVKITYFTQLDFVTHTMHLCAVFLNETSSSAAADTARALKSVEILSAAAQLYEKSHLARRIALSCGIKISPVGSLD